MADAPQAIVPPHLTVRVICDKGHILSGLFIVFKLKARTDGGAWDDVTRVMEGTSPPGAEPTDPNAGATPRTKQQQANAKKYQGQHAAWETQRAASLEKPPDPADAFVVGFVDDEGYLVPAHTSSNPWYDAATRRDPDAYKLGVDEVYQACYVRHPDPELARAVSRFLNLRPGEAQPDADLKYGIASWQSPLKEVTVTNEPTASGDQYVFKLTETAGDYFPPGPSRYEHWALYLDMPHATCATVSDQVEKLQEDLALLRYPTGELYPFKFRGDDPATKARETDHKLLETFFISRDLTKRVQFAQAKASNPKLQVNDKEAKYLREYVFRVQSQVAASIGGFQRDLSAGKAFLLSHGAQAYGGNEWAYTLGGPLVGLTATSPAHPKGWTMPAYWYRGVVCEFTANMLEHFRASDLRKPGSVLLPTGKTGWEVYLQERAAVAVDAWAALLTAFGVHYTNPKRPGSDYSVHAGSSFRRLVDDPWPGSIKGSMHNSGFAIDLAGGGHRESASFWPVRYEADWVPIAPSDKNYPGTETEAQRAAVDRGNLDYKLYFQLYVHSNLDVYGRDPAGALTTLRRNLDTFGSDGPGGLTHYYKNTVFRGLSGEVVDAYVTAACSKPIGYANRIQNMSDDQILRQFFRREVHQFLVNAYEADGGTSLRAHAPNQAADGFGTVATAKSWVNASALAYELDIERIPAHQTSVREQTFLWGDSKPKNTAPVTLSMLNYMTVPSSQDMDLVALLHDIAAPPSEAPENVHFTRGIPVGPKNATFPPVQPRTLAREFIRNWRTQLADQDAAFKPKQKASNDPAVATGAQIKVVLSAVPGKDRAVADAASMFDGFAEEKFVALHVGAAASAHITANTVKTGSEIGTAIRAALTAFQTAATQRWAEEDRQAAGAASSTPADLPQRTRTQARTQQQERARQLADRAKEGARAAPDWTIVVQPVFITENINPASLPFLPSHWVTLPRSTSPSHLEWWHYQHRKCGKNWGTAVEECGYSKEILGVPRTGNNEASPTVHRGAGFGPELDDQVGEFNLGQPTNVYRTPGTGGGPTGG